MANWFQSAPPHGERPPLTERYESSRMFQSAPPHGERHRFTVKHNATFRFNPRPRTGSDLDAPEATH